MISYEPFWKKMRERDVTQYYLIRYCGFSPSQISRLRHDMPVSTETIRAICEVLRCPVEDVVAYVPDEDEGEGE